MKKRYGFMDVIRLVAMLGIVYYHMVITLYICGIRQYESIRPLFENANMHIAKACVGLFFMISGAGLMLSTKDKEEFDLKDYYKKRFVKILIPFYLVYVLYLIGFMLLTQQGLDAVYNKGASPLTFIFTILGMDAYVSSFGIPTFSLGIGEWFLGALVMMYIIFPLLRWALLKNKWITLLVMGIYYVIILLTYPLMSYAATVPGYVNFTCKIMEFFLGMFFITVIDKIPNWISLSIGGLLSVFFLLFPNTININDNLLVLIENVSLFLLLAGLEIIFSKLPKLMKLISFLCAYSYIFFLCHHVIIEYMTLQHIGVPFSNKDVAILFIQEFVVITVITIIVDAMLKLPGFVRKRLNKKKT